MFYIFETIKKQKTRGTTQIVRKTHHSSDSNKSFALTQQTHVDAYFYHFGSRLGSDKSLENFVIGLQQPPTLLKNSVIRPSSSQPLIFIDIILTHFLFFVNTYFHFFLRFFSFYINILFFHQNQVHFLVLFHYLLDFFHNSCYNFFITKKRKAIK